MDELKRLNEHPHSLAYELLVEVKASARRWFIIALIELGIILSMVGGIIWYLSLPVEEYETTDIDAVSGNANYIGNDMNGDINNGEN